MRPAGDTRDRHAIESARVAFGGAIPGWVCVLGVLLVAFASAPPHVRAQEESSPRPGAPPAILSVAPSADARLLVCRVDAAGLPSARAAESMQGGLPATVEYALALLDARDHTIAESRVTFRLAFDLWEEVFRVDGAGPPRRFAGLDEMRAFLAVVERLPVAPLERLEQGERYRVRAELSHHAIAAVERSRLGAWLSGDDAGDDARAALARDANAREVSFSVGRLIRAIYGGSSDDDPPAAIAFSSWFRPEELPRAPSADSSAAQTMGEE